MDFAKLGLQHLNVSLLLSISHWFAQRKPLKELHVTIYSKTHVFNNHVLFTREQDCKCNVINVFIT